MSSILVHTAEVKSPHDIKETGNVLAAGVELLDGSGTMFQTFQIRGAGTIGQTSRLTFRPESLKFGPFALIADTAKQSATRGVARCR